MTKTYFRKIAPYLAIAVGMLALFTFVVSLPAVRVGDGSEYYGLFSAWQFAHRPWMTAAAFDHYDALVHTNGVLGLVSRQGLIDAFAPLRVGGTADFNHFWFYSLLAYACAKAAGIIGIVLTAHQAFLVVHMAVLGMTMGLGYRYFEWKGALAVTLMLLASPMFWFINKVHTEFLTVCLVLSGVILMRAHRYLAAALCIALASTQNPSFALIACVPLFYRAVLQREQAYRFVDVVLAVAIVLAVLAHPAYYFARYGVVTPQLLAGGASMGANLSTFYVWIVDPDLGLLPNWPLGLAVVLASIGIWISRNPVSGPAEFGSDAGASARWIGFALFYTAVNLYAHASTVNLNSGATPGLARYAVWYLPLGFPLFLHVFRLFSGRTWLRYAGAVFAVAATAVSMQVNNPNNHEQYSEPSLSSAFIQQHLPGLYNPPWEVFAERFSGLGENMYAKRARAVMGPDCAKMLVFSGADYRDVIAPSTCMYDQAKLDALVNDGAIGRTAGNAGNRAPYYVRLATADTAGLLRPVPVGRHNVGLAGDGGTILGDGWGGREDWGSWSSKPVATLVLPCKATAATLTLYLRPFQQQTIHISSDAGSLWKGPVTGPDNPVVLLLGADSCNAGRRNIILDIPDAVSPMKLGLSNDGRILGVGLSEWDLQPR